MLLLSTTDQRWMRESAAVLAADGIAGRFHPLAQKSRWTLEVPDFQGERAVARLSEQLAEDLDQPPVTDAGPTVTLWLQPAFAAGVGMALALLGLFVLTGPAFRQGSQVGPEVLVPDKVFLGEWWRLVTAATLHADIEHALSNAAFLVLLGWAAAERFGPGVMVAIWLVTAVLGNVASLWAPGAGWSVGASGGLFGLLGAAAGHALRCANMRPLMSWQRARALGASVLLLAFTAFSPRANLYAHLGGAAAGLGVGLVVARAPSPTWVQLTAGLGTVLVIFACWQLS